MNRREFLHLISTAGAVPAVAGTASGGPARAKFPPEPIGDSFDLLAVFGDPGPIMDVQLFGDDLLIWTTRTIYRVHGMDGQWTIYPFLTVARARSEHL